MDYVPKQSNFRNYTKYYICGRHFEVNQYKKLTSLHFQFLVDCSGDQESDKTPETAFLNKKSALLQLIEKSPVSKTIVFCNKVCFSYKCNNLFGFFSEIRNVQF